MSEVKKTEPFLEQRTSLPVCLIIIAIVTAVMIFLCHQSYRKNNPKMYRPSTVSETKTYIPSYIKPGETGKIHKDISRVIKK